MDNPKKFIKQKTIDIKYFKYTSKIKHLPPYVSPPFVNLGPLLLTWFNFNPSTDK